MNSGWQTQVQDQPALGVAGRRFTNNPIFTVPAGPGGLVAGGGDTGLGVPVGRFAWTYPPEDPNDAPTLVQNFGTGGPTGFVPNDTQALNTVYLSDAGMAIAPGFPMYLIEAGDYLCVNDGATAAVYGQKAYADFATGKVSFAATATPATGASATGSTIAPVTNVAFTGSIQDNILTVSAVGTGPLYPGTTLSGTGVASGTMLGKQISGAAGSTGTYYVLTPGQTVASTAITGTYGLFTVGTVTVGNFAVNQVLNATGAVVAGTTITFLISGTGGTGSTFAVNNDTNVTSQTISAVSNVETKFYARSGAAPGGIVKISSTTLAGAVAS